MALLSSLLPHSCRCARNRGFFIAKLPFFVEGNQLPADFSRQDSGAEIVIAENGTNRHEHFSRTKLLVTSMVLWLPELLLHWSMSLTFRHLPGVLN
ncbi:hypothetical protein HN011_005872 [Eciton burchellii]|nr:hypothetical protein HN011_005872 [Eciton burchellii]